MTYKGYQIIVENYIYKLKGYPNETYLTMLDVMHVIDKLPGI